MPGWMSNTHQSGSGIGSSLMATRSSNLLSEHVAASPVHRSNTVSDSPYLAPTESSPQLHGMTIQNYIAPRLSGALDLTVSNDESQATNQCLNITNRGVNSSAAAAEAETTVVFESAFLAAGLDAAHGECTPELRACQNAMSTSQRAANKLQKLREWLASLDTIRDKLAKYCVHHYWLYHVWSTALASADTVCCVQAI